MKHLIWIAALLFCLSANAEKNLEYKNELIKRWEDNPQYAKEFIHKHKISIVLDDAPFLPDNFDLSLGLRDKLMFADGAGGTFNALTNTITINYVWLLMDHVTLVQKLGLLDLDKKSGRTLADVYDILAAKYFWVVAHELAHAEIYYKQKVSIHCLEEELYAEICAYKAYKKALPNYQEEWKKSYGLEVDKYIFGFSKQAQSKDIVVLQNVIAQRYKDYCSIEEKGFALDGLAVAQKDLKELLALIISTPDVKSINYHSHRLPVEALRLIYQSRVDFFKSPEKINKLKVFFRDNLKFD